MTRKQTRQAVSHEAALPACDVGPAAVQLLLDRVERLSVGEHQDQARPLHVVGAGRSRSSPQFKLVTILPAENDHRLGGHTA
jgi:hypothetical protein